MTRLIDRLRPSMASEAERAIRLPDPQDVALLSQTWVMQDYERILQTYLSYVVAGYLSNSVVWSVILARLQMLAQAEFRFQNRTSKEMFGTDALTLLEEPWPNGTTADLIAKMEQHVSIAGNAFVRGEPDRLVVMRPDWTEIVSTHVPGEVWDELNDRPGVHDTVVGYLYSEGGIGVGEPQFYDVSQVAHWAPYPDPLSRWRGMSWMTPVLREINADTSMTEHRQTFFDRAATPNIALKYPRKVDSDRLDEIRAMVRARHGGPSNSGEVMLLDEGADLTVVGSTFESMRFTDVQAAGEARIAGAAGVPPILANLQAGLDAATYANYRLALKAFSDGTCSYLWRSMCSSLSKLVSVPGGSRLWWDTTNIPALRDDELARAQAAQVQASAASTLLTAGFTADSIIAYLGSSDLSQLQHTGLVSVQLYKQAAKDDPVLPDTALPDVPPNLKPPSVQVA